jgi:serine protease
MAASAGVLEGRDFAPGEIIVGFESGQSPQVLDVQGETLVRLQALGGHAGVYAVPTGLTVQQAHASARTVAGVRYAEPNYVRQASSVDEYRSFQWHFDQVDAEGSWMYSTGAGVTVAVIDTGVTSGPLDGLGLMVPGWDFIDDDADASDENGHGTHVAGTIAQATNNGLGSAGLAYDAAIMPLRVLDADGTGLVSDTALAIDYAVSNGAQVINLSLGSYWFSAAEADAILRAVDAGVFVAAASGNSSGFTVDYPARHEGVIGVAATDSAMGRAWYSNRGDGVDIAAPGGDTSLDLDGNGYGDGVIQETFVVGADGEKDWGYYLFDGTSMAAPHVAGAAALMMSIGATAAEAESHLLGTAVDLGDPGWDREHGEGLVQPVDALESWLDMVPDPIDADGDGFDVDADCDDTSADSFPGALDICGDGIDQDCDGVDASCGPDLCDASFRVVRYRRGQLGAIVDSQWATGLELWVNDAHVGDLDYNEDKRRWEGSFPTDVPEQVEIYADCDQWVRYVPE